MAPRRTRNESGIGVKPSRAAIGSMGINSVIAATASVASVSARPGVLEKNGRLVQMTSTMAEAEMTDSMNQPVRNCSGEAPRIQSSAPNVR